jgi:hypothetical protein
VVGLQRNLDAAGDCWDQFVTGLVIYCAYVGSVKTDFACDRRYGLYRELKSETTNLLGTGVLVH